MKRLLILSGKGGTGKTTTAAAFANFSGARALADCDVDAPNLHLVAGVEGEAEEFLLVRKRLALMQKNAWAVTYAWSIADLMQLNARVIFAISMNMPAKAVAYVPTYALGRRLPCSRTWQVKSSFIKAKKFFPPHA